MASDNANPATGDRGVQQKVHRSGKNAAGLNNQDFPPSQAADPFGTRDAESVTAEIVPPSVQAVLDEHVPVIRRNAKRIIDDAFDIGRRLAEVKGLLGRAAFLPWLEREFKWSEDTAERLIALHVLQRRIPEVADVSLPITGLYLLAAPSTPLETAEAVIAKAQDGERVSVTEIKATIDSARVRKPRLPSYIPTQEAAPKPITPAPTPKKGARNARLGRAATAQSKEHLQWFAVACRQYLPHVTVDEHRQEARRLVAELTDGAQ
jgi:hypothetical protein